jgi:prepilin signal peptidase PulO-like enzyme (type II secretory pathway)
MVTWLVGNRLAGLVWDAPVGPTVAFAVAIAAGIVTSLVAGARLARVVRREG